MLVPAAVKLELTGPFDLGLTLDISRRFSSVVRAAAPIFRAAVRVQDEPVLMEVRQASPSQPALLVTSQSARFAGRLAAIARWVLFVDLDLRPFYRLLGRYPRLATIARDLHGLKPMRPSSLFEMMVIAVTEQQISMAAAHSIRERIIIRYGDRVEDLWAFPLPAALARSRIQGLMACGLSQRKAEYIRDMAGQVVDHRLDLEAMAAASDSQVRETITHLRGFGPWSADYILVRGLARVDCVPVGDLGVRTVVGAYLGQGSRLSPAGVEKALKPFAPYRGLTAFYLLAHARAPKTGMS
jgi:DNA-3-methyladenine glycosylase II